HRRGPESEQFGPTGSKRPWSAGCRGSRSTGADGRCGPGFRSRTHKTENCRSSDVARGFSLAIAAPGTIRESNAARQGLVRRFDPESTTVSVEMPVADA